MKRILSLLGALLFLPSLAFANFPSVTRGATSVIVPLAVLDSASTSGGRKASILYNAAGLACYYTQEGGTAQAITLATMTAGTWATGGWIYNSTTGDYELGVPNAAFTTTTARWVKISCFGASGMLQVDLVIPLVDFGPYSTGTAQAVGTNTLTAASTDSAGDNAYANGTQLTIDSATTGAGQTKCVTANVNSTKVLTVDSNWSPTLTGTVRYSLSPNAACRGVTVAVAAVTGAVGSVTGNVGGNVTGSVGSLGATAKTDVKTQVTDALNVDTYAELAAVPGASPTIAQMLQWVYEVNRFKLEQTGTTATLRKADSTTSLSTSAVSDDGTTAARGKFN